MEKLRTIWLVLKSDAYMVLSDIGVASLIPLNPDTIGDLQLEADKFNEWLEELRNELILEERANK